MNACLDIYTKLIIAFVSFIAPLMVYLLSVSNAGIALFRSQEEELTNQLQRILTNRQDQALSLHSAIVEMGMETLERSSKRSRRRGNLLNPKRQLIRIFSVFLGSLICIMFYDVNKDPHYNMWPLIYDPILLVGSIVLFVTGLVILQQIAWTSIDAKNNIERQAQERQRITPGDGEITPGSN